MCSQTLHDNCSYFQVKVWFCVDVCVTFHTLGCLYACCYDHERLPVLESDLTQQREATLLLIKYSFCFLLLWGKQRHEGDRSHTCLHAHTLTHTHVRALARREGGGKNKRAPLEITSSSSVDLATPYPCPHQDVAMITAAASFLTNSLTRSDLQISEAWSFLSQQKSAASSAVQLRLCGSVGVTVHTATDMNNHVSAFPRHQVYIISRGKHIKSSSFRLRTQVTPSSCSGSTCDW